MRARVHLSVCLVAGGGEGKESARWLFGNGLCLHLLC